MSNEIPWKTYRFREDINGVEVIAEIKYWAKDYQVEIIHPIQTNLSGAHIMHMIPVQYILDGQREPTRIPILEEVRKMIIQALHDHEYIGDDDAIFS